MFEAGRVGEHGDLLGTEHGRAGQDSKHRLLIEGYGYRWDHVGGLDYLLRRNDTGKRANPIITAEGIAVGARSVVLRLRRSPAYVSLLRDFSAAISTGSPSVSRT